MTAVNILFLHKIIFQGRQPDPQSILGKAQNLNCKNFGARYDQGDDSVYISVSAYDGANKK